MKSEARRDGAEGCCEFLPECDGYFQRQVGKVKKTKPGGYIRKGHSVNTHLGVENCGWQKSGKAEAGGDGGEVDRGW